MKGEAAPARSAVVVGASGFLGREICLRLEERGIAVQPLVTPRLRCPGTRLSQVKVRVDAKLVEQLQNQIGVADVVINAAGLTPDRSADASELMGANALLPATLAIATSATGARLIHISTAAVQGGQPRLTATGRMSPTSTYSLSKARGEQLVRFFAPRSVSLRPGSVHGPTRVMTSRLIGFARSRYSCTLRPGTRATPQMHVTNVACGVCHLALVSVEPPAVVLQPGEAFTTSSFLRLLGAGRAPHLLPALLGPLATATRATSTKLLPTISQRLRRIELLLRGQEQEDSWLSSDGFVLPFSHVDWSHMVQDMRVEALG